MNTEEINLILDTISKLGEGAKDAFVFYLLAIYGMPIVSTLIKALAVVGVIKIILSGIKTIVINVNDSIKEEEDIRKKIRKTESISLLILERLCKEADIKWFNLNDEYFVSKNIERELSELIIKGKTKT
jgi:hypothetical protein